jgi:hypothetical protein
MSFKDLVHWAFFNVCCYKDEMTETRLYKEATVFCYDITPWQGGVDRAIVLNCVRKLCK